MFLKGGHRTYYPYGDTFKREGVAVDSYLGITDVNSTALGKLGGVVTWEPSIAMLKYPLRLFLAHVPPPFPAPDNHDVDMDVHTVHSLCSDYIYVL